MVFQANNRMRSCFAAGSFIAMLIFSGCHRGGDGPKVTPIPPRPDPLLGKWVMIGDNGTGANGAVADYRADGTVVFTEKGKTTTVKYRREPGKAWLDRRTAGSDMKEFGGALAAFRKPGIEMIEFADSKGNYYDYGGTLLTLDPDRRVLYNMLTQLWCRPGDEARVKANFDIK